MTESVHYILTLTCRDQPGIVKALATGIGQCGGNILSSAQSSDPVTGTFVMRTEFETSETEIRAVRAAIDAEVDGFDPVVTLRPRGQLRRVLIMVSAFDHCLRDLLNRWRSGNCAIDIPVVVSNHEDCRSPRRVLRHPLRRPPRHRRTKAEAEERLLSLVDDRTPSTSSCSPATCRSCRDGPADGSSVGRAINIHHSFLPGFKGAKPYHQAYDRGVKLIGATAHFVTADLDEGPIIEQDVERVTHTDSAEQMVTIGRDIERVVLSRALDLVAGDRVFMLGRRTIVFPR